MKLSNEDICVVASETRLVYQDLVRRLSGTVPRIGAFNFDITLDDENDQSYSVSVNVDEERVEVYDNNAAIDVFIAPLSLIGQADEGIAAS